MPSIANGFTVHVDLRDLRRKMELLGVRISTNVIRRGLLAGAGIIRDDARSRVPVRTGALKKAIIAETDRQGSTRDRLIANVKIAPKSFITTKGRAKAVSRKVQKERGKRTVRGEIYPRAYAHLVEFGTNPHHVGKGSKRSKGVGSGLMHPGTAPQPFLRPAYDTKGMAAKTEIERVVRVELEKELVKLAQSSVRGATA